MQLGWVDVAGTHASGVLNRLNRCELHAGGVRTRCQTYFGFAMA
mgnify:CR=1 FL=1